MEPRKIVSKTVAKKQRKSTLKSKERNNGNYNSNNSNKRQRHIDNGESQERKKRKLNGYNQQTVEDQINYLTQRNRTLIQELRRSKREKDQHEIESNYYKQRMNYYHEQMLYYKPYKDKYLNLKSKYERNKVESPPLHHIHDKEEEEEDVDLNTNSLNKHQKNNDKQDIHNNNHKNTNEETINIPIDYIEISSSPSPPASNDYHERNKQIDTDSDGNESNEPILRPEDNANSFNDEPSNTNNNQNNGECINDKNEEHNQLQSILASHLKALEFCNIDDVVFHDENDMETERKEHEVISVEDDDDNDNDKELLWEDVHTVSVKCRFCGQHFDVYDVYIDHLKHHFDTDSSKQWLKCTENGCNKQFMADIPFMQHLPVHGHQHPFHCKMKTIDGKLCEYVSSNKHNLILHLKAKKHNIFVQKFQKKTDRNWEDCHYISVDCKFCGQHFDEYDKYTYHLEHHFKIDPSRQWLKCNENGCKNKRFRQHTIFIQHLSVHDGYQHPFHCKLKTSNGKLCKYSCSSKYTLLLHLKTKKHNINVQNFPNTKKKKKKKMKKTKRGWNNNNNNYNYVWKDCHYISVNCKFCGKHFDDYDEYIYHMKHHFEAANQWLKCNESGCNKRFISTIPFMKHLSVHGHQDPFHCNMKAIGGKICQFETCSKHGLIKHFRKKHTK